MRKDKYGSAKEVFYVWSGGGIEQVHKDAEGITAQSSPEPVHQPRPEDQRRYARLDLRLPILYKVLGINSSRIPVQVRPYLLAQSTNISPIGLCFTLAEQFETGTVLALTIHMVEKREKYTAVGRVVWARPAEIPGHFLTGVEFVVVEEGNLKEDDHSRMEAFMRELNAQHSNPTPETP
jgi:hypothetical protein